MVQSLLLILMIILCIFLIFSIYKKPFDFSSNPCNFKILEPRYKIINDKHIAIFDVVVSKKHRYFINFPLLFKFFSDDKFKTKVKILYSVPEEDEIEILLNKSIEFSGKVKEHYVYITNVIMGKITIEIEMDIEYGRPVVGFEILKNSICNLTREYKLELEFP